MHVTDTKQISSVFVKRKQTPAGANETLSVWIKRKQTFQNTDFSEQTPAGAKRRTGGLPRPDWWKDSALFGGQVDPLLPGFPFCLHCPLS